MARSGANRSAIHHFSLSLSLFKMLLSFGPNESEYEKFGETILIQKDLPFNLVEISPLRDSGDTQI
jgi:hypothetical protein